MKENAKAITQPPPASLISCFTANFGGTVSKRWKKEKKEGKVVKQIKAPSFCPTQNKADCFFFSLSPPSLSPIVIVSFM